ncbi:TPA: helix-turn-helix domain-containing protein [Yersinia enterocolitica]
MSNLFNGEVVKFDSEFSSRVSATRKAIGLTQTELAKQVGIVQRQIAAYEAGDAKPRDNVLVRLAKALGTTPEWLSCGGGSSPELKTFIPYTSVRQLPLLEMGSYADRFNDALAEADSFHPCSIGVGPNAFSMIILGNSMTGSGGYSFLHGSIVTFDPDIEPLSGSFVLYGYEEEMTFKQYFPDLFQITLRSLNDDYSDLVINKGDGAVIATAVYAEFKLP